MHITFCQSGMVHGDGTFDVVRGGISQLIVPALPGPVQIVALVESPAAETPPGQTHAIKIVMSGAASGWKSANFALPPASPGIRFATMLDMTATAYGVVEIVVTIGSHSTTDYITLVKAASA